MAYFQNAREFNVNNLSIRNVTNGPWNSSTGKSPLERLEETIAPGALHNSEERCDAPKCHPETRVAVQNEILSWISKGDTDNEPTKMMWLTGPAGSGKTAIAGSIAEACKKEGILAASFFFSSFSGSANRRSKKCLVATLAYQIRQQPSLRLRAMGPDDFHEDEPPTALQQYGKLMLRSIEHDPAIFSKRLSSQVEELILKPLRRLHSLIDHSTFPKVIVIDGLDECKAGKEQSQSRPLHGGSKPRTDADDQLEILSALMLAAKDPAFPFRILISSRPERAISTFFESPEFNNATVNIFLDEKYGPDDDIALFLRSKFAENRRIYNLSSAWPPEEAIRMLVADASGQFIYVTTVLRFVEAGPNPPPSQLDTVLKLRPSIQGSNPFALLDALYTLILMSSPNPRCAASWIQITQSFITRNINTNELAVERLPAVFSRQLLETTPGEGEHLLGNLRSLISIPPSDNTIAPYRTYHKSLLDFIEDRSRSSAIFGKWRWLNSPKGMFEDAVSWVLKNKGPRIPLTTELEADLFFDQFLSLVATELRATTVTYDVSWWAKKILSRPDPDRRSVLAKIYSDVHVHCYLVCGWACTCWRRRIIAECRAQGWKNVPKTSRKRQSIREIETLFEPPTGRRSMYH